MLATVTNAEAMSTALGGLSINGKLIVLGSLSNRRTMILTVPANIRATTVVEWSACPP